LNIDQKRELEEGLPGFTGTEEYHRVQTFRRKPVYATDGVKFLCDKAGSYWLMDIIASWQKALLGEMFQTWKLVVDPRRSAQTTCTDGNNNTLVTQAIPFTDFPLDEINLYAQVDVEKIVIMLPGEY